MKFEEWQLKMKNEKCSDNKSQIESSAYEDKISSLEHISKNDFKQIILDLEKDLDATMEKELVKMRDENVISNNIFEHLIHSSMKNSIHLLDYDDGVSFLEDHHFPTTRIKEKDSVLVFDFPLFVSLFWNRANFDEKLHEKSKEVLVGGKIIPWNRLYKVLHDDINEKLFSVKIRDIFKNRGVSITRLNKYGVHLPNSYYYIARVRYKDD